MLVDLLLLATGCSTAAALIDAAHKPAALWRVAGLRRGQWIAAITALPMLGPLAYRIYACGRMKIEQAWRQLEEAPAELPSTSDIGSPLDERALGETASSSAI